MTDATPGTSERGPSGRAAGAGSLLAVLWAWLAVDLLSPRTLWIPGTEQTVAMASVGVGAAILLLVLGALLRPLAAYVADHGVVRRVRHGPTLIAGALVFGLAWLALQRRAPGSNPSGAVAIVVGAATGIVSVSLEGITIATGRRLGALGLLAAGTALAPTAAPHVSEALARVAADSVAVATSIPLVVILSLVVLAWPRAPLPALSSPPDWEIRSRPRPTGSSRAFWTVALVGLLGWPSQMEGTLELHLRRLGDDAQVFSGGWQWGSVAGAAIYLLLCRRVPLRWLVPSALVLSAAATFPLPWVTEARGLLRAGLAFGTTHALAYAALTHLAMEASPRGREAWTFAMIRLVGNIGASVILLPASLVANLGTIEKLPLFTSTATALALVALWFVPRELLGDATVTTWPKAARMPAPPAASDGNSSRPSPG